MKGRTVLAEFACGVDVGGTFTDICIMDETTVSSVSRRQHRSPDPIDGIMAGIDKAAIRSEQGWRCFHMAR